MKKQAHRYREQASDGVGSGCGFIWVEVWEVQIPGCKIGSSMYCTMKGI